MTEFALVGLFFITLLLGTLDFGFFVFDMSSTNQANRKASRAASLQQYGEIVNCPTTGYAADFSDPAQRDLQKIICYTKAASRLEAARVRVLVAFESADDPEIAGSSVVGDSIVVCSMTAGRSLTGIFRPVLDNVVIKAKTRARLVDLEGKPEFTIASGGETPFPNRNWDFCTHPATLPEDDPSSVTTTTTSPTTTIWTQTTTTVAPSVAPTTPITMVPVTPTTVAPIVGPTIPTTSPTPTTVLIGPSIPS